MAIFTDDFEAEDDNFNTNWTGKTGTAVIDHVTVHHNLHSAKVTVSNFTSNVYKTIADQTDFNIRFYWTPSALVAASRDDHILQLDGDGTMQVRLDSNPTAGGVQTWKLSYRDGGGWNDASSATNPPAVGRWTLIELRHKIGAGTGEEELWIDETKVIDLSGLSNNDRGAHSDTCRLQGYKEAGGDDKYWYFDCVKVDSVYIGPEAGGSTVKKGSSLANTVTTMLNSKMLFSACNRFPKVLPRRF